MPKGSKKFGKDEKEVKEKAEKKEKKEQPGLETYPLASPGTSRPRTVPRRKLNARGLPKGQLSMLKKIAEKTPKDLVESDSDSESEDPNILYRGFTTKTEDLNRDIQSKYVMNKKKGTPIKIKGKGKGKLDKDADPSDEGVRDAIGSAWHSHVSRTNPNTSFISTSRSIKPAAYFGTLGGEGEKVIGSKKIRPKKKQNKDEDVEAETPKTKPIYAPKAGRIIKIDRSKIRVGPKQDIHSIMDSTNPEHYNAYLKKSGQTATNARKGQELSLYAPEGYKIPKEAILGYYNVKPLEYFGDDKKGHEEMIARYRELKDKSDQNHFVKKFYYAPTDEPEKNRPPRKYEFEYFPLDKNPLNVGRKVRKKEKDVEMKSASEHASAGAGSGYGASSSHSSASSSDRAASPPRTASPARSSSRTPTDIPRFTHSYPPLPPSLAAPYPPSTPFPTLAAGSFDMSGFPPLPGSPRPIDPFVFNGDPNFSPLSSNPFSLGAPSAPPPSYGDFSAPPPFPLSPAPFGPPPTPFRYAKGGPVQTKKKISKPTTPVRNQTPKRNQAPKPVQRRVAPKPRKISMEESFRRMMKKEFL